MKKRLLLSTALCAVVLCAAAFNTQNFHTKKITSAQRAVFTQKKQSQKLVQAKPAITSADLVRYDQHANMLKVSRVKNVTPTALYNRPVGTYIPSMIGNEDPQYLGYSYTTPGYFGSAFSTPWTFRNLSTDATSYTWNWGDSIKYSTATNGVFKDGDNDFLFNGAYKAPLLKSINGVDTASYQISAGTADYPLLYSSIDKQYVGVPDYFSNTAEGNSNGNSIWYVGASGGTSLSGSGKGYFFGTCLRATDGTNGTKVNSLVNIYEKPMSPLVIKDVCLFGVSVDGNDPVPADKFLTLSVIRIDENGKLTTDTLASSKITGSDVVTDEYKNCYFPFTFVDTDPSTGFETPVSLVVKDAFAIVLSGLEQPGMDFGILTDYANLIDGSSYFTKVDAVTGVWDGGLYKSSKNNMNMYFMLNSYFNYLYTDNQTQTLVAPTQGGSAVNEAKESGAVIYSFFNVTDSVTNEVMVAIDDTTLPTWLSVTYDDSYFKDYNVLMFDFTADALPVGVTERTANVVFNSYGAQTTVTVKQNAATGLINVKDPNVSVNNTANSMNLNYTNDYNKAMLYNVSGQLLGEYTLPNSGKYSITSNDISKGIYFVKFVGKKTENVKVIR